MAQCPSFLFYFVNHVMVDKFEFIDLCKDKIEECKVQKFLMTKRKYRGNYLVNMSRALTATSKANFPLSHFPTGQYTRTLVPACTVQ